ncbi:MAG: hypothetical protein ACTHXO_04420 [Actinomycetaceae bacterium]
MPDRSPQSSPAAPISVRVVQVVCLLQAVALGVLTAGLVLDLVRGDAIIGSTTAMLGVLYAALAVLLVLAARQVGRGSAGLRGALITWWILAGVSVLTIDLALTIAVPAAASCVVGIVALVWPTTREFTAPRRTRR